MTQRVSTCVGIKQLPIGVTGIVMRGIRPSPLAAENAEVKVSFGKNCDGGSWLGGISADNDESN
jgi:hypothetical protein